MSNSKEESKGIVSKNRAIKIFVSLGFKTATGWDVARLNKKLTKLHTLIEGAELDDKTQKRVNEILRAQSKGRKIVVVDPENAAADKQRGKEVEAAQKRVKECKAEKKEKTVQKEKKEKTEKKTKKTTKKAVEKKADKKPGVIMSVLEFVKTHGPVSEKKILSLLKKRFPDRDSGSMGRSIPKIPGYLTKTKNMDVIGKDEKGRFYIKK